MKSQINQEIEILEQKNSERLKHIDKMNKALSEFAGDEESTPHKHLKKTISLVEDAIVEERKEIIKLQKLLSLKEL